MNIQVCQKREDRAVSVTHLLTWISVAQIQHVKVIVPYQFRHQIGVSTVLSQWIHH